MFTLRTVFTYGQGSEVKETTNRFLGENYQVYYRDSYYFKRRITEEPSNFKPVFAIVLADEVESHLLYDTNYYIVTDNGKTFEKIYKSESFNELSNKVSDK